MVYMHFSARSAVAATARTGQLTRSPLPPESIQKALKINSAFAAAQTLLNHPQQSAG
jgi:hypothetical protein